MGSNSDSNSSSDEGEQIRVSFKLASEVTDRSLEVPSEPIAVPASVGRKGLAAVINHLLDRQVVRDANDSDQDDDSDDDEDDKDKLPAIPFEFVLKDNNRLLRSAVEREARRHGLSLEKPLAILYFPAQEAPELQEESKSQPDWISCLSHSTVVGEKNKNTNYLCAASYDGSLKVYQPKLQQSSSKEEKEDKKEEEVVLHEVASAEEAHRGPVKCLSTMVDARNNSTILMASGSIDHTLYIHSFDTKTKQLDKQQIQCQHEGYSSAVTSLDFVNDNNNTPLLASGDWDGNLALWDLQAAEPIPVTKKSKTDDSATKQSSKKTLAPKLLIPQAHYSQISGLSWGNVHKKQSSSSSSSNSLITGSWDHSIKSWDIERQECVLSLNGSKVVACLDTSYHSEGIVATGHPDCNIRLWDVRNNSSSNDKESLAVSDKTFRPSHKQWVTAVQWSPQNPYHLASTSHDGTVKVWDIRSPIPLHTVRVFPKTEKGLCLAYGQPVQKEEGSDTTATSLFLGGSDCIVKHFSTNER